VLREFITLGCFTRVVLLDETGDRAIKWSEGPKLDSLLETTGFVNVLLSREEEVLAVDAMSA